MKKIFILFAFALLFITCKKDKKVDPKEVLLDPTGTWTLYSWKTNKIDATVAEYPCMTENELVLNADLTVKGDYLGTDTCYVTQNLVDNMPGGLRGTAIGVPGQTPYLGAWHRNGNDIYISGLRYIITKVDNKLYLTFKDTITGNGNTDIRTTVDIKK